MNLTGLLKQYNIPFDLSRYKAGWIHVQCPFCDDGSTSYHLGIHINGLFGNCWKCGGHGSRQTLSRVLNVPFSQIDEVISPYQGRLSIINLLNEKEKPKVTSLKLPDNTLSKAETDYLIERHFNPWLLEYLFGIKGGGWIGEWKNRIIIPIYIAGKLVTWTARTIIPDREPRYKNLSNDESIIPPKKTFFNLDNCYNKTVALLEGPFDVLRFGDNGICGFGITLTQAQIKVLMDRFKTIYILFDDEKAARKQALMYGHQLSGSGLKVINITGAFKDYGCKDAGEMSPYNMKKMKEALF